MRSSALGGRDRASSDSNEQRRPPRRVRRARAVPTCGGAEAPSQDLSLAVCLAVFITFFVAFCLGAFTRPYVDRLWQQRCQNRSPGSDNAYYNEGFCDKIQAAENAQHARVALHPAHHDLKFCENQDPFSGATGSPHSAVIADRTPGMCRKDTGSQQKREQCGDHPGAGSRGDKLLPNASAAQCILHRQPNVDSNAWISAGLHRSYRNDILGEINYSPCEHSVGMPVLADKAQAGSGSIHKDSNELDPPLSREVIAALSKTQTHPKAQRTEKNEGREHTELLPPELSEETQASTSMSVLRAQQQSLKGAIAEEELSAYYSLVTIGDPGGMDPSPPFLPPGRGSDLYGAPGTKLPEQKHAPPDTQHELDTNYDSDEGSLFTLSSVSSEDTRNVTEEEADGKESHRTPDSGLSQDSATLFRSLEDNITSQKIQGKCEGQEDHFEKPLISGPDSGLCDGHLESACSINKFEDPSTLPRSLGHSPSSDEVTGMFVYDRVTGPRSEAAEWHCSLRDLDIIDVDVLPQTPPRSAAVPSDPDKSAGHEKDSDIYACDPSVQGTDPAPNSVLFQIPTGENLRPSQQDSEGCNVKSNPMDTYAHEGRVCPLEDSNSRKVTSPTQWLQFCGDEPALPCERRGGEYFEEGRPGH